MKLLRFENGFYEIKYQNSGLIRFTWYFLQTRISCFLYL